MGYRKNLTNPYLYRQFSNNPSEMFNYTMTNVMDGFYDNALLNTTEGSFKAVCLSGIKTEDNTGGTKYIDVIVRPLTEFGAILPDPAGMTDPIKINETISLHAAIFTARSDFELEDSNPPLFGQILNCYFEDGSISNSDFTGLRFSQPTGYEENKSYKDLATIEGVVSKVDLDWNKSSLLGEDEFVGPPAPGDIYTRAQRLRDAGVKIRGKATPSKNSGDEELAKKAGIPVNVLRAFRLIESGPLGPSALRFEPHLWARKLGTDPPKGFTRNDKVVYSKVSSETNKTAFVAAYNVNATVAVKSTSFGLYQVLGEHGIRAYGSAQKFWSAFQKNPTQASDNMVVAWFKKNPRAVKAANSLDFTKLALAYNGKQQAKHYYDALIAEAYLEAVNAYG